MSLQEISLDDCVGITLNKLGGYADSLLLFEFEAVHLHMSVSGLGMNGTSGIEINDINSQK